MQELSIKLLGSFEVLRGGQPIDAKEWLRRKNQSLLKYLVTYRGQPHTQDQLIEVLYPERPTSANVRNLLARISEVRYILEPHLSRGSESSYIIRLAQGTYTFSDTAPCSVDIEAYRHTTHQGNRCFAAENWGQALSHYVRAIQLYRGDFLVEDLYDGWTEDVREECRSLQLDTLVNTGTCHLKVGSYEQSLQAYRAALQLDPLDERAHRGKMLALYNLGDLRRAAQAYEECARVLEEADLEPEEETIDLYQSIQGDSLPKVRPEVRHNLPHSATPFVGREEELAAIERELLRPETRCLTLLGPGGFGKTRLALETARKVLHQFPDGVFLITTPEDVTVDRYVSIIAEAMGHRLADRGDPQQQLINELRTMRALLIIDNGEHSLDASNLLDQIVSHTSVTLLAASRARLHMPGEVLIEIAGLGVPASDEWPVVANSDAAQLFSDRMRRVDHRFVLNPDVAADVGRICRALGGIPLALEMASAWGRALSCREIAERIEHDLSILELPSSVQNGQHASILGIFTHTWSQLTADEQDAFARLSAFRGGMSSEAALQVSRKSLSVLMALRDKALLHRDVSGRFSIHDLLRQFVEGQLNLDPALLAEAHRAHAAYFAGLLPSAQPKLVSSSQVVALRDLQVDWGNITLAWQRCARNGYFDLIESMLATFHRMHILRSRWHELREALELALECLSAQGDQGTNKGGGTHPRLRAALHVKYGDVLFHLAEYARAKEILSAALEETEQVGDAALHAECLNAYGRLMNATGAAQEAEESMRRSVEILRTAGSAHQLGMALCTYGVFHNQHRLYDKALTILEESLSIFRELGDPSETSSVLLSLGTTYGVTYGAQGDWEPARQLYMEGLALAQEVGHRRLILMANANLGQLHFNLKEYEAAKECYANAAHIAHVTNDRYSIMFTSYYLTMACSKLGEVDEAMASLQTGLAALRKESVVVFSLRLVYAAGHLLQALGRLEEALALFRFAYEHEGTPPPARPGIGTDAKLVEEKLAAEAVQRASQLGDALTLEQVEAWLYGGMTGELVGQMKSALSS